MVETSWREQMAEFGLDFDPRVPNTGSIDFGLQKIQERLHWDRNFPVSPSNSPRLFIFDGLENLTSSLLHFGFTDSEDSTRGLHRKLDETYKDPVDALRYAILYPIPLSGHQVDDLQVYSENDFKDNDIYDPH